MPSHRFHRSASPEGVVALLWNVRPSESDPYKLRFIFVAGLPIRLVRLSCDTAPYSETFAPTLNMASNGDYYNTMPAQPSPMFTQHGPDAYSRPMYAQSGTSMYSAQHLS